MTNVKFLFILSGGIEHEFFMLRKIHWFSRQVGIPSLYGSGFIPSPTLRQSPAYDIIQKIEACPQIFFIVSMVRALIRLMRVQRKRAKCGALSLIDRLCAAHIMPKRSHVDGERSKTSPAVDTILHV